MTNRFLRTRSLGKSQPYLVQVNETQESTTYLNASINANIFPENKTGKGKLRDRYHNVDSVDNIPAIKSGLKEKLLRESAKSNDKQKRNVLKIFIGKIFVPQTSGWVGAHKIRKALYTSDENCLG